MYALRTQKEYLHISGLLRKLDAAVNSVYIVSCNLSTADGLINGAICTLKYIDFTQCEEKYSKYTMGTI